MNRPVHIWLVFLGCLALLLSAMSWVTWHTLSLERERQTTAHEAAKLERVRLALWRLDFQASTLVIRENARPPEAFRAFHAPEGFFNKDNTEVKKGEVLTPSPLLGVPPDLVMLHFQLDGQGRATSPQVPFGNARTLALQNYLNPGDIQSSESRLEKLRTLLAKPGNGARVGLPHVSQREGMLDELTRDWQDAITNGQMLCAWNAVPPAPAPPPAAPITSTTPAKPGAAQTIPLGNDFAGKDVYLQGQIASNSYENTLRKSAVESQKMETLPQQIQMKGKTGVSKNDAITSGQKGSYSASSSSRSPAKGDGWKEKAPAPVSAYDDKSSMASGQKAQREDKQAEASPLNGPMPSQPQERVQADLDARSRTELKTALSKANQPAFPDERPQSSPTVTVTPASGMNVAAGNIAIAPASSPAPITPASTPSLPPVATAKPLQGFWIEDALLLTREASLDGARVLQGVWLDWPKLREQWLAQVRDLFPQAALDPAPNALPGEPVQDDPLRLASLPVRLATGPFAVAPVPFWTPMRSSLAVAWLCMGLAAVAVGAVLFGTVSLSERRAAFVSAVTHELRTPLTTFRLYSEMLASGMVQDESQKKNYLGTLEAEAGRLSHLVENVLAYARIERGSARAQVESVSIGEVLDRVLPRLQQRAEQAGMEIVVDASEEERKVLLRVDVSALEQILFNLVDNACKYAAPRAADKTIHVQASTRGPLAMLRVRDHGAGIAPQERRRVFRPFHKSADKAAHSAPGVGLGLALCERLSKALGGRLSLEKGPEGTGASFVLELPRAVG